MTYVNGKVKGIANQIEKLVTLAPNHPHQAFTVLRLSILAQATYLQRTLDVPAKFFQPIEDIMTSEAIPYLSFLLYDTHEMQKMLDTLRIQRIFYMYACMYVYIYNIIIMELSIFRKTAIMTSVLNNKRFNNINGNINIERH